MVFPRKLPFTSTFSSVYKDQHTFKLLTISKQSLRKETTHQLIPCRTTRKMISAPLQLVTLAAFLSVALSCSCFSQPFETRFCNTDVSVRARIFARSDNCPGNCDPIEDQANGEIYYWAVVQEKFKGSAPTIIRLITRVNGALCGVNLSVNSQYLLNLGSKQGTFSYSIGLCHFPTLWNNVTPAQMNFLDNPTC